MAHFTKLFCSNWFCEHETGLRYSYSSLEVGTPVSFSQNGFGEWEVSSSHIALRSVFTMEILAAVRMCLVERGGSGYYRR